MAVLQSTSASGCEETAAALPKMMLLPLLLLPLIAAVM